MDRLRWEFLVTCIDIAVYKSITSAIQKANGAINYTSTISTAKAYVNRRKIDAIFLDMDLEGALEMVQSVRRGNSNRNAVIFACTSAGGDSARLLNAGVNFVLQKPLEPEAVLHALESANPMMEAERRRYLRHQLMVPVVIKRDGQEQKAITSNISRGGMAVRCHDTYERGSAIHFAFELPAGAIRGRGEVAWSSTEGYMGIKFFLLGDQEKKFLTVWLTQKESDRR